MARRNRTQRLGVAADTDDDFWAEVEDVVEFAEGLPDTFLECRELGHLWRPYHATFNEYGGYDRVLRCSRCYTKRVQVITRRGVVVKNSYLHPEGYLHVGMGRITGDARGAMRLVSLQRQVKTAESKAKKRKAS